MTRLALALACLLALAAPAHAADRTPGYVTAWEFRHTAVGQVMTQVFSDWGTPGRLVRVWTDDTGHYHLRHYHDSQGYGSRVQTTSRLGVDGRYHLVSSAWCVVDDTARTAVGWSCFHYPWP